MRLLNLTTRKKTDFDHSVFFKNDVNIPNPIFATSLGVLFSDDCLNVLPALKGEIIDTIFADPPFNLGKKYSDEFDDFMPDNEYLEWSKQWLSHCIRLLKPGGSLFLYNLPKWNIPLGSYLMEQGLIFRHWIAISLKLILPIPNRLYPSHYSLLYFTKGKPKTFRKIRTPIETCRHCGGEIRDYGGHRQAMNAKGVNLTDIWHDIPPVRHAKFKSKKRVVNQLSTKILDRVIEMSTQEGDIVLDPFGGSGTTYDVCERKRRRWIGIERYHSAEIIERLLTGNVHPHANTDIIDGGE